ncbi:MAG: hypothetical protein DWP98_11170 [Bacteroidetes bacterium]|nr:MAG: hypothetical protein DWP98_11170 [Bacteroidota bacterium]MBL1144208.1 hypothetical protein [Bacteroidota bacterium]NOG57004.1 hypothetical protein [Bacteroidota bacterium]
MNFKDNKLSIEVEEFDFLRIYRICFIPVFLTILTFLSIVVYASSPLLLIFTIPFWLLGLIMIIVNINSFKETQSIEITDSFLIINKQRPIFPKSIKIQISDINSIKLQPIEIIRKTNRENILVWIKGFQNHIKLPTIETKDSIHYFSEFTKSIEVKSEVIQVLNEKIQKRKTVKN